MSVRDFLLWCYFVEIFMICCFGKERLEDPKDIRNINAHRRSYYQEAEFTDLGSEYVTGSIWPKPRLESRSKEKYFTFDPKTFEFKCNKKNEIIENAFERYKELTFPNKDIVVDNELDEIIKLMVTIEDFEQPLSIEMNETYTLIINKPVASLNANSVWGALRGLETFSQTVFLQKSSYVVNKNKIIDFPRFPYRGFLIDTSRHFLPVPKILQFLDALAYSKFNVLHWHIVDDPSFPYVSKKFPQLSANGAFTKKHVYSADDVQKIIQFARLRGIRVMPEFDTPGHTHSWGGVDDLLTECTSTSQSEELFQDMKGPINPIKESTYTFLKQFYEEVAEVFPDDFLHLGGDEVDFQCWMSNTDIINWLKNKGNKANGTVLHTYFLNKLVKITANLNKTNIVWQEVFDDGVKLTKDTIINVWKQEGWREELLKVTKKGHPAIISSMWYLNYIAYALDWPKFYHSDPHDFAGTKAQKDLVIGGSAAMWGEYADATNMLQRTFGRGFAVAERLWSSKNERSVKKALKRIWEHRCRYLDRGIPAEPVTRSKYCLNEWGGNP